MAAPKKNKTVGGWEFALQALKYLVDNGLGVIVIVAAALVATSWVLTRDLVSADRAKMLVQLTGTPAIAWSGWFVAVVEFAAFNIIYKYLTKVHRDEMDRVATTKNEALQSGLPFKLASSNPSKPKSNS